MYENKLAFVYSRAIDQEKSVNKKVEPKAAGKTAAKKKVVKKAVTTKAVAKKATAKATTPKGNPSRLAISPRERYEMIATMAYYRAEQRNFEPGHDVEDWLDCERTIDMMLSG